jgi:hypothetical protein
MSVKHCIVRTLVFLYPAPWRREYGAELQDLLLARPLGLAAFADVVWSALRQRCRATEPATLLGVTMMAIVATGLVSNRAAPPRGGTEFGAVLRPSNMTWPSVVVSPLKAVAGIAGTGVTFELYVLLLLFAGAWTNLRYGGPISRAAIAGARMTFLAGLPVVVLALTMMAGLIDVRLVQPGGVATAIVDGPLAYTYYGAEPFPWFSFAALMAPVFALPLAAIWGAVGGQLGRRINHFRHRLVRS